MWLPWVRCHLMCHFQHPPGQLSFLTSVRLPPNPRSDQPTRNQCTLCLVYMCKSIPNQACHSGVHHLVPSRQDPPQGGVEVVTYPCFKRRRELSCFVVIPHTFTTVWSEWANFMLCNVEWEGQSCCWIQNFEVYLRLSIILAFRTTFLIQWAQSAASITSM